MALAKSSPDCVAPAPEVIAGGTKLGVLKSEGSNPPQPACVDAEDAGVRAVRRTVPEPAGTLVEKLYWLRWIVDPKTRGVLVLKGPFEAVTAFVGVVASVRKSTIPGGAPVRELVSVRACEPTGVRAIAPQANERQIVMMNRRTFPPPQKAAKRMPIGNRGLSS